MSYKEEGIWEDWIKDGISDHEMDRQLTYKVKWSKVEKKKVLLYISYLFLQLVNKL